MSANDMSNKHGAVVVLSGGQDSATCLAWAVKNYDTVHACIFDYGQSNEIEIEFAKRNADHFACETTKVIDLRVLGTVCSSSMIRSDVDQPSDTKQRVSAERAEPSNVYLVAQPATFVPNRNAMMLGLAHAYAQTVGAQALITGIGWKDRIDSPDCTPEFVCAIEDALNLGASTAIEIVNPRMTMTKAEVWRFAENLGVLDYIRHETLTCHNGDHETWNEWGFGCGECNPCRLRAKGYAEFKAMPIRTKERVAS